jgi:hypothetical protein
MKKQLLRRGFHKNKLKLAKGNKSGVALEIEVSYRIFADAQNVPAS